MTKRYTTAMQAGYDVIGDVHGRARELTDLLTILGYARRNGAWCHPFRKAVFVGDLIDRGPEIETVLQIVAEMVEARSAICILGNYERDFIYYNVELPGGKSLRERVEAGDRRLEETHRQLENGSLKFWIDWCRRLPVVFEVPGLRVSHAAWNDRAAEFWRDRNLSCPELCAKLAESESLPSQYLDWLLIGPRMFYEVEGRRKGVRVRWFKTHTELTPRTIRSAALDHDPSLPNRLLTPAEQHLLWGYRKDSPILITGRQVPFPHVPRLSSRRNLTCINHPAVFGERLCAYRWLGESWLKRSNLVVAPVTKEAAAAVD